ncbi:MAG TPA: recombinase family protein [Candidatus Enterousia intestinigallinarum]|uniref:Recombinase family protein n=1 Tax=Candidatus Enterousia intestinigallinarum TaxID=2840790 RepID=A0A9D1JWA3_9PROT|nr:recombinase family protein [Candidatus Enterousia intestinigallinarum]
MKAVILARVSSREQENGMSIDAQLDNLNKYIQRNGLTLLKTFQITESSTKGDRKKFVEMLNFVKAQREKIAIVADYQRHKDKAQRQDLYISILFTF